MGIFRNWTIAAFGSLVACSSGSDEGPMPASSNGSPTELASQKEIASHQQLVGRFQFDVDPNANEVLRITPLPIEEPIAHGVEDGVGRVSSRLVSVLSTAQLTGPGVWDPVTHTISATVRIRNSSAVAFDEPRMQVASVNQPSVQFQLTHWGAGGIGSAWGYADIEPAPGANNESAKQKIRIYDPESLPFSFSVDVLADTVPQTPVIPDADDDRYNGEPVSEAAGGDCDDTDPDQNPEGLVCLPILCNRADASLRACYELDGVTTDDSAYGNHLTATNTAFGDGREGQGLVTSASSAVSANSSSSLNPTRLSVDMWIFPSTMPTGSARMGLLEKDNQYGLYLYPGGEVQCLFGLSGSTGVATAIATGVNAATWNHVACTYDGTTLRLYINGRLVDTDRLSGNMRQLTGALRIGEEAPGGGDQFLGTIDRVRIWSTAISPTAVCQAAGTC